MLGGGEGGAFKGVPSQAGSALDETVYCTALQLLVLPICISWKRSFVFHVKGGGRWGGSGLERFYVILTREPRRRVLPATLTNILITGSFPLFASIEAVGTLRLPRS